MTSTRVRRGLAAALATALAATGLGLAAPAAQAATATASISPSTVSPGAATSFTVTVNGTSDLTGSAQVQVPSSFGAFTVTSTTSPVVSGQSWSTSLSGRTLTFTAYNPPSGNGNAYKLGAGQTLTATFSATAPTMTGDHPWTVGVRDSTTGNGAYGAVSPAPTVRVGNRTQTITFAPLADRTFGDEPFTVSATGGQSGQPVLFSTSGSCTNTGTSVEITGAGSCSVTASQAAGNGYDAATPVTRTFSVAKATQSITLPPVDTQTFGDDPVALGGSASSGLPVSYDVSGPCSLDGSSVALDGAGDCTVTATQAGNADYLAAPSQSVTFTIAKAAATLSLGDLSAVYDGEEHLATATTDPAGLSGVTVTYERDGEPVDAPEDAGTYDVTATLTNADYDAEQVTGSLVVAPRPVTGAFTAEDRAYDGTTDATVLTRDVVGEVEGDDVSLTDGTATFASKNAGTHAVTLSGATLTGDDAANYALGEVADATATISAKLVTAAVTGGDKTYDGTTGTTVTPQQLDGRVGSDDVEVVVDSADFDGKDVAQGRTVTALVHLEGDDAANYELTTGTATTLANIWAKQLLASFTAQDKTYDTTRTATVVPGALTGVVGEESVSLVVGSPLFDTPGVGTDKPVTGTLSLTGADASNYEVDPASSATAYADITPATVTGSIVADDKTYDGTRTATVTPSLSGVLGTDAVGVSATEATFDREDVGTRTATAGLALTGTDAANYVLAGETASDEAAITARTVTGSFTAADKVWDGTTAATVSGRSLSGAVGGDDVALSGGTATFDTPAVGAGKTVTGSGFGLTGADAGNYALASTTLTTTASIAALYSGRGFFAPVDMTPTGAATKVFNTVKGGQTVPLKFELFNAQSGVEQTSLGTLGADAAQQAAAFKVGTVSCSTSATEDAVELTTTGGTSVRYDTTGGQYVQNWKTPTTLGCYSVAVKAVDGTAVGAAYFRILK